MNVSTADAVLAAAAFVYVLLSAKHEHTANECVSIKSRGTEKDRI